MLFIEKAFAPRCVAQALEQLQCCEGATMKTIQVSDEIYDRLREFIVDPFEDTPQNVITRLVDIACKAKNRWSSFEPKELDGPQQPSMAARARMTNQSPDDSEVML